jgi:predicted TIM-barrel fold metal-dependent hydrolase
MTPSAVDLIRSLARHLEQNPGRLVIDADAHATDTSRLEGALRERYLSTKGYYFGRPVSAEDLLREMDQAGVDMALIWQNPAATVYDDNPEHNSQALLAANTYVRDAALRYPGRFIPAGWTDPKGCGLANALAIAEKLVLDYGFLIVKMNPAQNRYPMDSPEVLRVVDRIVELGAIPAFHFGADTPHTPPECLERVAARHPDWPIVAVHMGGGGASYSRAEEPCLQARELGLRRPNIRYILSAKRDTHMESDLIAYQLAGEPYCRNLFCGSDAPYGRIAWNFGGFRAMLAGLMNGAGHTDERVRSSPGLFAPEAAANYLGGNLARFVLDGYRRLLATHAEAAAV